jgi:hypothetical protein
MLTEACELGEVPKPEAMLHQLQYFHSFVYECLAIVCKQVAPHFVLAQPTLNKEKLITIPYQRKGKCDITNKSKISLNSHSTFVRIKAE